MIRKTSENFINESLTLACRYMAASEAQQEFHWVYGSGHYETSSEYPVTANTLLWKMCTKICERVVNISLTAAIAPISYVRAVVA